MKTMDNDTKKTQSSLRLLFLGTGAADYDWNRYGEPGMRGCASTLLDGSVLLDAGVTAWKSLTRWRVNPAALTDLVVTHTHDDHFDPPAIREIVSARDVSCAPLRIWTTPEGCDLLRSELPSARCDLHALSWGDSFMAGADLKFTALPSNHLIHERLREETFWYLIESPRANLLYALDGAWMTPRAAHLLYGRPLDAIVWDGTMERTGDMRAFEHSDLTMLELEIAALKARGTVHDGTRQIITHLARTLWPEEAEARRRAAARGFLMASDGLEVAVAPQAAGSP